jgi:hypothetical protein
MQNLPSIGQRGGNFEMDAAYKKKATFELNKLNDFELHENSKKG